MNKEDILRSLKRNRMGFIEEEYIIQDNIAKQFDKDHIEYKKEYKLGPRNRIDFYIEELGIGIETKKGKPNKDNLFKQLTRYSQFESIKELIVVVERSVKLPQSINGKNITIISLNKLQGVAI